MHSFSDVFPVNTKTWGFLLIIYGLLGLGERGVKRMVYYRYDEKFGYMNRGDSNGKQHG